MTLGTPCGREPFSLTRHGRFHRPLVLILFGLSCPLRVVASLLGMVTVMGLPLDLQVPIRVVLVLPLSNFTVMVRGSRLEPVSWAP